MNQPTTEVEVSTADRIAELRDDIEHTQSINTLYRELKDLFHSIFFIGSEYDQFVKYLDYMRINCFGTRESYYYQRDDPRHDHKQTELLFRGIVDTVKAITRLDDDADQRKAQLKMMLYRQKKLYKKLNRQVPLGLLTTWTKVIPEIGRGFHQSGKEWTVVSLYQNGVESFVVECVETEDSKIWPGKIEPVSFNISFIRKVIDVQRGLPKIITDTYRKPAHIRYSKPRYNYQVKHQKIELTEEEVNQKRWSVDRPMSDVWQPRSSRYVVDYHRQEEWMMHVIDTISGKWTDQYYDTSRLIAMLMDKGVIQIERTFAGDGAWASWKLSANRKRVKSCLRRNLNRFILDRNKLLADEEAEQERMYADLDMDYDDKYPESVTE